MEKAFRKNHYDDDDDDDDGDGGDSDDDGIPLIINEKKGNSFDLSELFSSNIVAKSML